MSAKLNAREQLVAAAEWLGYQHEDLSFGLKSPEDGLKLWRYWMARPAELPEFCDQADDEDQTLCMKHVKKALGYDPWRRALAEDAP
jgi:hypothetical protein